MKSIGKYPLIMRTYLDGKLTNTSHYDRVIYKDKFDRFWINSGNNKHQAYPSGSGVGLHFVTDFTIRSLPLSTPLLPIKHHGVV